MAALNAIGVDAFSTLHLRRGDALADCDTSVAKAAHLLPLIPCALPCPPPPKRYRALHYLCIPTPPYPPPTPSLATLAR